MKSYICITPKICHLTFLSLFSFTYFSIEGERLNYGRRVQSNKGVEQHTLSHFSYRIFQYFSGGGKEKKKVLFCVW